MDELYPFATALKGVSYAVLVEDYQFSDSETPHSHQHSCGFSQIDIRDMVFTSKEFTCTTDSTVFICRELCSPTCNLRHSVRA